MHQEFLRWARCWRDALGLAWHAGLARRGFQRSACLAAALFAAPMAAAQAPVRTQVLTDVVDGRTVADWTAEWWRWAHGQVIEPYLDPDGRLCDLGQDDGPVWFLAGTDGTFSPTRECVVPEGRYLLLPVINMIHWRPRGATFGCDTLVARAAVNNDRLVSAVVLLDGEPLGDVRKWRQRTSACFHWDPEDPESPLAAADGYWLMLAPLPPGRYTLSVGANYAPGDAGYGGMHQNFEYVIYVGEDHRPHDKRVALEEKRPVPFAWH